MASRLQSSIENYFTIRYGHDNLPICAHTKANTPGGRQQIAKMMHEMGLRSGIEIGTAYGESAVMWCEAIPGLELTCIDPYIGSRERPYETAKRRAEEHGFTLLRMESMSAVGYFPDASVDFVHIDGDHTFDACVQDIVRYVPKVKFGGLILIHDYFPFRKAGVMKAVDAYTHCHRIDPWYITHADITVFWEKGVERC